MAEIEVAQPTEAQKLFLFMAGELQGACSHIFSSFEEYFRSGKEPESAFKGSGAAGNGKKKRGRAKKNPDKPKRKPTAFNNFVKETISEFKAAGKLDSFKGDNNGTCLAIHAPLTCLIKPLQTPVVALCHLDHLDVGGMSTVLSTIACLTNLVMSLVHQRILYRGYEPRKGIRP